ncbi:hypothetical protein NCCP1664_24320 [Zafaria cholistanensis]|uniref:DUF3027 domain-containing protein n=1 Tax=Zafaria cholistanensis TaxID=1682741 RepID=A0A5A7NV53_9MICC|nr:DUF3027 domain-containing protein [Zafaria cholistanensis]GER23937.1 hypothetical protein NCCP1664_24320 [Zafaria cholistanensis]
MARRPKLDAMLAAAVDAARAAVLEIAPAEAVGAHAGAFADGDRLVTHRFTANVAGYAGWEWYATLSRIPRGKEASVCEVGLLPGPGALLAPEWVPWADRVKPEELAEQQAAEQAALQAEHDAGYGHENGHDGDPAEPDPAEQVITEQGITQQGITEQDLAEADA